MIFGVPMKRRNFITLLGGAAAWPLAARAQQTGRMPHVGVLVSASPPHPFAEAFQRGLRSLGYADGQNIRLEFRYSEGRTDRAEQLASELVSLSVDIIVAHFVPAVVAAMGATRSIPIVMAPHGAPLQMGIIDSLARPGGNVTGLSAMDAEIGGKRIQLLQELIPNLSRIAVLAAYRTASSFSGPFVEDLRSAAMRAGVRFEPILVGGPQEFEGAFASMKKSEAQAVIVMPFFDPHGRLLAELAARQRLPYMSGSREVVATGGLIAVSANFPILYERAAFYVDKIIKGAKPAELPVEQPTRFEFIINIKTAKTLGLSVPPTLLARADEVIE